MGTTSPNTSPLKDSLTTSLKRWGSTSEIFKDLLALAEKHGAEYSLNDYFGEKTSLLSFDETYDLWDFSDTKPKYIKQAHQANILANLIVLLADEIKEKEGLDIMSSLGVFAVDEFVIIDDD